MMIKKIVHSNYIKASNLIFISTGLGAMNMALYPNILSNLFVFIVGIFTLMFLVGIGILARLGFSWFKYVFLGLFLFGLIAIPGMIKNFEKNPGIGVINLIQTLLQIWATVLLFKIPNQNGS